MTFFKAPEANAKIAELTNGLALAQTEIAKLKDEVATRDATIKSVTAERDAAIRQNTTLSAERDAARAEAKAATEAVDKLKAEAKDAEARAAQILSGLGVSHALSRAPKEETTEGSKDAAALWAEYHKIQDAPGRRAFYLKHKEVMGA